MLKWNQQLTPEIVRRLAAAVGELGLAIEAEAKRELQPGHGVLTGTLRRSIHAAEPGHSFPAHAAADLGGQAPLAKRDGNRLVVVVGSGLVYALAIHQGWSDGQNKLRGNFAGYHYLTNAVEKVRPRALGIIERSMRG